jgi:acyl carrier protein
MSETQKEIMDQQTFLAQMDEILELPKGTLQGGETLADLENWDSLAMMNFIALASDQYGLTLSPRVISGCKNVSDLMNLAQHQA